MQIVGLCCCAAFILWTFWRNGKRYPSVSAAVWIPTILILVLGSRSLSEWILGGTHTAMESNRVSDVLGNDVPGNFIDELFYLFILVSSLTVVQLRKIRWSSILQNNYVMAALYLFFGLSIAWSSDPDGSFKRLVKEFSLWLCVAILASEKNPGRSVRTAYVRCASVLIPLSMVLTKYFPNYSRIYDIAGNIQVRGSAQQKNSLGEQVLICLLFLIWDELEERPLRGVFDLRRIPLDRVCLFLMGGWLLSLSHSKTALVCLVIGVALMLPRRRLNSRAANLAIFTSALALPALLFFSESFSSVLAPAVRALGRNLTLTGRTNIWDNIHLTTVNPIIGAGYWNFWGGPGGKAISVAMRTNIPNAHNGYLDIYIDGGIAGLGLLLLAFITVGGKLIRQISGKMQNISHSARFSFAFLIVALLYNLTESTFVRLSFIWFTTLLAILNMPRYCFANAQEIETKKSWRSQLGNQLPSNL